MDNTTVLLAEALGRYSAYGFCIRQIDSMDAGGDNRLRQIRHKIAARYQEAADDWQAIAATNDLLLTSEIFTYEENNYGREEGKL